MRRPIVCLVVVAVFLGGCGGGGQATHTPEPTQVTEVANTPTLEPTLTPTAVQPTTTPTKTPTPPPSVTVAPAIEPTVTPAPTPEPLVAVAELEGSVGPVYSLTWSPDGDTLASAGFGQVKLWDAESLTETATLKGHTFYVWGVAWSPDGSTLASASPAGTVRLWDAETREELAALDAGSAMCVAWSHDGERLAAGTMSSNTNVWDVKTGEVLHDMELPQEESSVIGVGWSPDDQTLAAGQWNGHVVLWQAASGKQEQVIKGYTKARCDTNGLAWSPDGSVLATAHQDGVVRLWNPGSGDLLRTLERHGGWARGIAWSPDGRLIATTGQDATVRVWDAETGTLLFKEVGGNLPIWSVAWSPSGGRLAAGSGLYNVKTTNGKVYVWDVPVNASTSDVSETDVSDESLPSSTGTADPSLGATRTRPADGMEMVYVTGGEFLMGSSDAQIEMAISLCEQFPDDYGKCKRAAFEPESPQHPVTVSGFWIDGTEVTNAQYARCVEAGGCKPSRLVNNPQYNQADYPVAGIPWQDAASYCAWAGGRLPTEAEWEYAARGPEGSIYPWGDAFECVKSSIWDDHGCEDGYPGPSPVGAFPEGVSWCGAQDMTGNAWEWVADFYGPYPEESQIDPTGAASGDERILRGGSWGYGPPFVRSAYRYPVPPSADYLAVGFRCAVSVGE